MWLFVYLKWRFFKITQLTLTESEFWYMYAPKRALKANQFCVIENMERLNLLISHEYVFDIYFLFHPKNNFNDREVTMEK